MKCPRCGSRDTAKILYGLPAYDEDLQEKLDAGKIVLGGCCIGLCDPKYHCNACKKDFGTPPFLHSKKHGEEFYPMIVESIHFSDGGFFDGYYDLTIKKDGGNIIMEAVAPFEQNRVSRALQPEEWTRIVDTMYDKLYLHEWKKRFDSDALDGEQWELELGLIGNRRRTYYGSNAFPPYWKELKRLFYPFFAEVRGIDRRDKFVTKAGDMQKVTLEEAREGMAKLEKQLQKYEEEHGYDKLWAEIQEKYRQD